MLCAQFILRKRDVIPEEVRPLPCRSWGCDYCAPQRRRQLMAEAASGEPNKLLTLTVNVAVGDSPSHRRDILHAAWRNLVKRINRQFQLPPERRWLMTAPDGATFQNIAAYSITSETPQRAIEGLPYFAFIERTKRGEPHLHILLRCPFIPQAWISQQMRDLAGSPIVWIEKIENTAKAIAYVSKYVTKAPAQFGNKKRYWQSRNWKVNEGDQDAETFKKHRDVEVIRERWTDYSRRKSSEGWTAELTTDGWIKYWRPGAHPQWEERNPWLLYHEQPPPLPSPRPPYGGHSAPAPLPPPPPAERA